MRIILDFDGLDGSLSAPAGIRNDTEGAVEAPEIASHNSVTLAGSEPQTDIGTVTESVPKVGGTSQIEFDDLDFTEPALNDGDSTQIESDDLGVTERALNDVESAQIESDDLDITVRVPLQPEAIEGNHSDAHPLEEAPSAEPFFKKVGVNHHRPSRGSRQTVSLAGVVAVFLIGLFSGTGVLYWWNVRDTFDPRLSQEVESLAPESAYATEPETPLFTDEVSDTVKNLPPPAVVQAQIESHIPSSVQEDTLFPQGSSVNQEPPASSEKGEDEIHQVSPNSNRQDRSNVWTIPFPFSELEVRSQILKDFLPLLLKCDGSLVITGHTCSLGPQEKNYYVGLARAKSVREALVKLGVPSERLRVNSAGPDRPVATNDTKNGRQENRRAVIHCLME